LSDVTLPQLGETVTEGTITRWMKAVGDSVARDEPLFEVSTDKVDSEVPSPASGVLTEIIVPEGDTVDVGARLAVISESDGAVAPAAAPAAPPPPAAAPAPQAAPPPPPPPPVAPPPAPAPAPVASAPPPPPQGFAPAPGTVQPPPPAPDYQPPASAPSVAAAREDSRVLSPVVRRLLADNNIDPASVTGTGIGGRITREDVLAVVDARHGATPPTPPEQFAAPAPTPAPVAPPVAAPAPAPAAPPASPVAQPQQVGTALTTLSGNDRVVPFSNMRRRTAEHMVRSKATSPHAFIGIEADFENIEQVRRTLGARFKAEEGFSLTYMPFICRATVEALRDYPNLNASVADDALVIHQQINLGIAVDLDHEGLIVPVIHRAEEITLRGMARRIRDVADRARNRQLSADDITGGTVSVTNDGPFGTYFTVPVINQPQVAILATDGIKRRPVVVSLPDGSEAIAIHSVGILGMSWDHRAVDGAYVSSFLARLVELLGQRDWAAEL